MITTKPRFASENGWSGDKHALNGKPSAKKRRPRRRVIMVGLMLVVLMLGGVYGLPWAQYRLTHVVTHEAVIVGDVTPIGARIEGQLKRLEVERGQRVHRGDVLAQLEDRHLRSRVAEATANLRRAIDEHNAQASYVDQQRKLLEVQLERGEADMELAAAKLAEAESEQPRWEREFERTERLVLSGAASESYMDQVRATRSATAANLAAVKAQHRAAGLEYDRAQVDLDGMAVHESRLHVLASEIEVVRCELATAEADLEAATIRAPQDGWIVQTIVGPGASVRVGQPILTFWDCDRFLVEAHVDEGDLSRIDIGTPADVMLPAYRGEVFAGRVEAICPLSNDVDDFGLHSPSPLLPNSNRFRVWISFDRVERPLLPGLSAVVGIHRDGQSDSEVQPTDYHAPAAILAQTAAADNDTVD